MRAVSPLLLVLRAYSAIVSPFLGPRCRFAPSCSTYAAAALDAHGLGTGGLLALRRILRCHPFSAGGYDPVPPRTPPAPRVPAAPAVHAASTGAPPCQC